MLNFSGHLIRSNRFFHWLRLLPDEHLDPGQHQVASISKEAKKSRDRWPWILKKTLRGNKPIKFDLRWWRRRLWQHRRRWQKRQNWQPWWQHLSRAKNETIHPMCVECRQTRVHTRTHTHTPSTHSKNEKEVGGIVFEWKRQKNEEERERDKEFVEVKQKEVS